MNRKRDLLNLAEAYGELLDKASVITEAKRINTSKLSATKGIGKGSFELVAGKPAKKDIDKSASDAFVQKDSGPKTGKDLLHKPIDTKNNDKKQNFYDPEKFSQLKVEKTHGKDINTCMSKSTFDKLFENVMGGGNIESTGPEDIDAGIDSSLDSPESEGELHDEEQDDDGDIHARLAKALDLLQGIQKELQGAEQDSDDIENDIDKEEDLDSSDDDDGFGEATDIKELGDKSGPLKKTTGKANVVGDETDKLVDGKEGDGTVTDKVGNEKGKEGKATPVTGKANVVAGKAGKVGTSLFAKN